MVHVPFSRKDGVQQGAVDARLTFLFGTNDAKRATHNKLSPTSGALLTGVDDTYICTLPSVTFPGLALHTNYFAEHGLQLNQGKTKG